MAHPARSTCATSALAEVEELEARLRRRDLRVDDSVLFAFYDARIPAHVTDVRAFDKWWKQARLEDDNYLDFNPEKLINEEAADYDDSQFPVSGCSAPTAAS